MPPDSVQSTVAVSGIYELEPVFHSFLRNEIGLTVDDVARFSPMSWAGSKNQSSRALILSVGADETPELRRQSEAFASELHRHGAAVELEIEAERHHMSVVLDLADPGSALGRRLLRLIVGQE